MLRVDQAPQHVRIEVEAGKIKEEHAGAELGKLGIENPAMLRQHGAGLLQKFFVVENSGGAGLGIFGNSLGIELADFFRELARVTLRSGNRQRRISRINVDRRDVQLKPRVRLLEIKAADALDVADKRNQLKLYVDPVAPFAFAQYEFLILHRESCDRFQRIDGHGKRFKRGRRALAESVVGSDQIRRDL